MFVEIACVILQAARGVTSHFNTTTNFDSRIFSLMGLLIFINTFILIGLMVTILLTPQINLINKIAFAAALGSLLISAYYGVKMANISNNQLSPHITGKVIPFLGWNLRAGDLRIPHFIGLHGLQFIPLFAYVIQQSSIPYKLPLVLVFIVMYYLFNLFSLPLIAMVQK